MGPLNLEQQVCIFKWKVTHNWTQLLLGLYVFCVHPSFFRYVLYLRHTHSHALRGKDTSASFILYIEENPRCLSSFRIKYELNESADLPLRQCMSYREHWAIKPGRPAALLRNYTWGLVVWPWFNKGDKGWEGEVEHFDFQSSGKQNKRKRFTHLGEMFCLYLYIICSWCWR